MPECDKDPSHRCSCQSDVCASVPIGVALTSESPAARDRLENSFRAWSKAPGIFIADGHGFIERVETLLEPMSIMDRGTVRAVPMLPGGEINPWASAPVDTILTRLKTAWLPGVLNDEQISFHMQPIVEADSLRIHGFEALMRCTDPSIGVNPFELIQAAKAHDALLKLDQTARRQAILQCAPKLEGEERLFINFLPMTVYDPNVCLRTTFKAADEAGLDVRRLVFEVVESEEFPDIDHLGAILSAYRRAGARVALDDLGSGNTAMTYVNRLSPDIVKIDREIIATAAAEREYGMLHGMVRHAKDRGITVLAEGVETASELALVRRLGVDLVQGYLIARPSAEPVRDFSSGIGAAA